LCADQLCTQVKNHSFSVIFPSLSCAGSEHSHAYTHCCLLRSCRKRTPLRRTRCSRVFARPAARRFTAFHALIHAACGAQSSRCVGGVPQAVRAAVGEDRSGLSVSRWLWRRERASRRHDRWLPRRRRAGSARVLRLRERRARRGQRHHSAGGTPSREPHNERISLSLAQADVAYAFGWVMVRLSNKVARRRARALPRPSRRLVRVGASQEPS
jgi:hypothetical protein